jgi:hypothetical protein
MPIMHTDREVREDGRLKSVTIKLDSQEREDVVRLHDGFSLRIHPYWSYQSGDSYGRIETPLAVCARSSRPREVEDFIEPLTDFRLLLSLAHGELVPCDSARARFDYRKDAGQVGEHWSPLWDQQLMEKPDRVSKTLRPKFSYASVGGAVGVARWLKFSRTHARFIHPVTMHALRPGLVVTTRLMELYAAIEYYVAASRRAKRPWATRGKIAEATVLGRHGGREFKKLVGDPDRWADVIHWMNNRNTHNPVDEDPVDIHWLNRSAEALITIISLNYASRRKLAASQFVGDIRTERVGREVRDLLSRYPEELPKSY